MTNNLKCFAIRLNGAVGEVTTTATLAINLSFHTCLDPGSGDQHECRLSGNVQAHSGRIIVFTGSSYLHGSFVMC